MTKFALIDRDTGDFFSYVSRESGNVRNTPDQQRVHVPISREPLPPFNPATEKLEPNERAKPLPFSPMTRWKIGYTVVPLTMAERDAQKNPSDELAAALDALKGTGATVDQLIDALTGKTGRQGRISGRR